MAKSVLVMDMPESCSKCKFLYEFQGIKKCQLMNVLNNGESRLSQHIFTEKRHDWCPLRELPEKANHPAYCDNGRFDKGWNACLDTILEKKVNENVMPGTRNEKRTEGAQENEKRK